MKVLFPRLSRISLENWLEYHPYNKEVSSDHYYIGLGNDIQHEIFHLDVNDNLVGADYKYLSAMLACYFEDIISQTNIWTAFIRENHKLYGKYLPFYDTSEYEFGEINIADIRFLIWHFCSNLSIQNHLIDPYFLENEEMAQIVYHLLNEQVGLAPRNEDLKKALVLAPDANIYQVETLMDYFFFDSYLNHYYTNSLMEEAILDIKNQKGVNRKNVDTLIHNKRVDLIFNAVSPILAQRSNEMLANWLGESHQQYNNLISMSEWKEGMYLYRETTASHVQVEHIATRTQLDIRMSHDTDWPSSFIQNETIIKAGFVEWNGEWWLMGKVLPIDKNQNVEASPQEKYLFTSVASQLGIVRRQEECFLEITGGNRLAFFNNKKDVFIFIDDVWSLYHRKYGKESIDRKMFDVHDITFGIDDDLENVTVFFNTNAGMEFYPDIAPCISGTNNPYYNATAETNIEDLMFDERVSSAFISHLIENNLIEIEPIFGEGGFQYVWNNCDFLLRYWKREHYTVKPKLIIE